MPYWFAFLILFFPSLAKTTLAQDIPSVISLNHKDLAKLHWPVDCQPGQDCWVMHYPDYQPGDGKAEDMHCGTRSDDSNSGVDIAVRDIAMLRKGIDILAARDGKIVRVRNGEPDRKATPEQLAQTKRDKKECGNAVLIDHGDKTQTLYCHLRNQSITVNANDRVKAGQKIAQMGLSGYTRFPHLHFSLYRDGKVIDPFTNISLDQPCGKAGQPLWNKKVSTPYQPVIIYDTGFYDDIPSLDQLDEGIRGKDIIAQTAERLVFWMSAFGLNKGDLVTLSITSPDGRLFATRSLSQDENKTRQYYYVGKTVTDLLAKGNYVAKATITRGEKKWETQSTVRVE